MRCRREETGRSLWWGEAMPEVPGPCRRRLFAVWNALTARRVLGFRRRVRVFVNGSAWRCRPASVLFEHEEIVIEVARFVPPHDNYGFPRHG